MIKDEKCIWCSEKLNKDTIALNQKMLGRNRKRYLCLSCLAEHLSCSIQDLQIKIEEFKEIGCTLFL